MQDFDHQPYVQGMEFLGPQALSGPAPGSYWDLQGQQG